MTFMKRALLAAVAILSMSACTPQQWIAVHFGADAPAAERVAWCESRLDPTAVSPRGGNHGLFQINSVHRSSFERVTGQPWSAVYDAGSNAQFARWLYDQSGWRPWTCQP